MKFAGQEVNVSNHFNHFLSNFPTEQILVTTLDHFSPMKKADMANSQLYMYQY